jgi:ribose transport system ATP-binding protein
MSSAVHDIFHGGRPVIPNTDADSHDGETLALSVRGLSKSFAGNIVLDDFRCAIKRGEIHALVGQNGSGKSTFIKILSGFHEPDRGGTVHIAGAELQFGAPESSYRLGCRFVHQDLALVPSESILDNLAFGVGFPTRLGTIRRRVALAGAREALLRVGVDADPEQTVATLGASQRTQLAIARALHHSSLHQPHVLVLDEPTATLPINEVHQLLDTVRAIAATDVAVVYVTHHLDEVYHIADNVSILRDGKLIATFPVAGIGRDDLVATLTGNEIETVTREADAAPSSQPDPVLAVEGLTCFPLRNITFGLHRGEIVGLAGLTGSGRESLLGAIFGAVQRQSGLILVNGNEVPPDRPDLAIRAGVGFLPSDRKAHGGIMLMNARENLTLSNLRAFWRRLLLRGSAEVEEARAWFSKMAVLPSSATESLLATFSGGNQQKIVFAKWLRLNLPVLLFDEPTQGIDVGAKAQLHRQLIQIAKKGTAVLMSSTDVDELVSLCDRILVLRKGQIAKEFPRETIASQAITEAIMFEAARK